MLPEINTVDQAALDRFILDLVEAGFERGMYGEFPAWRGPIDPSLADLTETTEMVIWLEPGWPHLQPHVAVKGLRPSVHLQGDRLCLWERGDESMAWMRLVDVRRRLAEWADRYRGAATTEDPNLDPDAYWVARDPVLATVDLGVIGWGDGGSGATTAVLEEPGLVLRVGVPGPLRVRWYGRAEMRQIPVNLDMLARALQRDQATNLHRELERVGEADGTDVLMIIWGTPVGQPTVLVLRLSRDPGTGEVRSTACEVARVDHDVLVLRAGPDAPTLRGKSVVVFGVGAIGSHLGVLLARSGVGKLTLVDGQRLRPGDIVRHAAPDATVGVPKAFATQLTLRQYAPWTTTTFVAEAPWGPGKIRELCEGADLIVDATGSITFPDLLDRSLVDTEVPLLSVALYRGGDVARVRLVPRNGVRLHERAEPQYRLIPTGPVEPAPVWETGCAAPVNNAPPASVASAAALAGRWAIELLSERTTDSIDIVEVYQPIEEPFDRIGTQRFGG